MKQLELELKKRLLIVEVLENFRDFDYYELSPNSNNFVVQYIPDGSRQRTGFNLPIGNYEFICKGSELTEEIAKGFSREVKALNPVDGTYSTCYPLAGRVINATRNAQESFISLLGDKGYYWDKNPYEQPIHINYEEENEFYSDLEYWKEAESRTFNPEKTIIFEIL